VVPIHTPPLRERIEDVPLLVQHFLDQYAKELGLRKPEIHPEAIDSLMERSWPGNVRELENAVGRAMILCRDNRLTSASFDAASVIGTKAGAVAAMPSTSHSLPVLDLKTLEKTAITAALAQTGGHRARAARLLGISERTLRNKLNGRNGDGEAI
jgi:DNA-binding NtrC family response regulator